MAGNDSVSWQACSRRLVDDFRVLLVDLDGVVYLDARPVPGAVESLNRAAGAGLSCRYVTNNASRPPADVAAHLRELGLTVADADVDTSAQEGAERLAAMVPAGSRVLAVGGPGVAVALGEVGLVAQSRFEEGVVGVLQGFGPDVGWRQLAEASYAVAAGASWVATNPDLTVPTSRGRAPGNGQLTAAVRDTTGVQPIVTGKPGPGLFELAVRRAGGGAALVVGDRLDTDIAGAINAELPSLLVLTGVTDVRALLDARPEERPTYLAADLGGLWSQHPAVERSEGWWVCREARARLSEAGLELSVPAGSQDDLDPLRSAAAAVWTAVDAGVAVDLDAVAATFSRPSR